MSSDTPETAFLTHTYQLPKTVHVDQLGVLVTGSPSDYYLILYYDPAAHPMDQRAYSWNIQIAKMVLVLSWNFLWIKKQQSIHIVTIVSRETSSQH